MRLLILTLILGFGFSGTANADARKRAVKKIDIQQYIPKRAMTQKEVLAASADVRETLANQSPEVICVLDQKLQQCLDAKPYIMLKPHVNGVKDYSLAEYAEKMHAEGTFVTDTTGLDIREMNFARLHLISDMAESIHPEKEYYGMGHSLEHGFVLLTEAEFNFSLEKAITDLRKISRSINLRDHFSRNFKSSQNRYKQKYLPARTEAPDTPQAQQ